MILLPKTLQPLANELIKKIKLLRIEIIIRLIIWTLRLQKSQASRVKAKLKDPNITAEECLAILKKAQEMLATTKSLVDYYKRLRLAKSFLNS